MRSYQLLRQWDGCATEGSASHASDGGSGDSPLSQGLRGDEGKSLLWELAALARDAAARDGGLDEGEGQYWAHLLAHYSKA